MPSLDHIIEFYGETCPHCIALRPVVEDLEKELGKSIREQGQELTKRAIAHRLAELQEHKKSAKSSRARNRSARRDDMMEQAMKVAQASKPRSSGTEGLSGSPAASAATTNASGWGDSTSGASGRKRGA